MSVLQAVRTQVKFDRDPIGFMQEARRNYGNLSRLEGRNHLSRLLLGRTLLAFGPEYNRQIYQETDLFHSKSIVLSGPRKSAQYRIRQSIFSVNEQSHQRMRHQLLPAFQRSMMQGYRDSIIELANGMLRQWEHGATRDLHRDCHLLVWGIVRKLLYGLEESEASEQLYRHLEHWMFQTFQPLVHVLPLNLPFFPFRRMLKDAEKLEQKFLELMKERRAALANNNDAFSHLLRFRSPDGKEVPDSELVGHALTLYLVAYETTGNSLTWMLFLLSQHPEIQQQLLDELAPWKGEVPSNEKLEQLPLLNRVVKESLRILPAVPYSYRRASRDGAIGPYFIARKTRIIFSHYVTHHMPELYPNPERFAPERWETCKPALGEYVPFGTGARMCLGSAMAQLVMKVGLSLILPRWKVAVVPNSTIDRKQGISLGPRGGLPVVIERQDRQLTVSPVQGNIHEMVELGRESAPQTSTRQDTRRAA
jgi:cytochrome P450